MFALSSDRKLVVYIPRLKLHVVLEEQFSGTLQVVWRIRACQVILILKLEE